MRLDIELNATSDGSIEGSIATADGPAVPFSGWLELLRALEEHASSGVTAKRMRSKPRPARGRAGLPRGPQQ